VQDNSESAENNATYEMDKFITEAYQLRITSITLDNYANEWHEAVRLRDAHAIEMDELRNSNRVLKTQV
jgi:ecotropic viral integration site 5 protein